jgi:hypothetical protein
MRILVAGWFSFEQMGASAGDLLARDSVCQWLKDAGYPFDIAVAKPFTGGIDWRMMEPDKYSDVIFVCGPFGNGWPVTEFIEKFRHSRLHGVNLSMLQNLEEWNPFKLLLERDSSRRTNPDIVFLSQQPLVPVVGVILVHPQAEYGKNAVHESVNLAIESLLKSREMAQVRIDTRLDINSTGLRSPAEIESLIARLDVVVTTRLHGLILAIKNSVPALAIDPIVGGAKIFQQSKSIDWPIVFKPNDATDIELNRALDYCLSNEAKQMAKECREKAIRKVSLARDIFMDELSICISSEGRL